MIEDGEVSSSSGDDEEGALSETIQPLKMFRFNDFIWDREIRSAKSVVKTYTADFEKSHFCQKDIREHTGCVNAVTVSHGEKLLATGGDDLHSRVWRFDDLILQKTPKPLSKTAEGHDSNVFSIEFDLDDKCIYSGERHGQIMKHDIETSQCICALEELRTHGDVYDLDHHPFDANSVVATYSRAVVMLDDRDRSQTVIMAPNHFGREYFTAQFHPETPVMLLISTEDHGPLLMDRRNAGAKIYARETFEGFPTGRIDWMGCQWSPSGNQFVGIRKAAPPVYFDFVNNRCFELKTQDIPTRYRNRKTLKSMTFIDDYTIATGSDHWGIHIWKVPRPNDTQAFEDESPLEEIKILRGHRSIPNQIKYSKQNQVLISSGVENSFKLWSHFRLPWSYDQPIERRKRGSYVARVIECEREKVEREEQEKKWRENGDMDGRQSYEDVFGGPADTGEDRRTLEMFDVENSDDDDSDLDFADDEERRAFLQTFHRHRMALGAVDAGGMEIGQFLERLGDFFGRRRNVNAQEDEEENEGNALERYFERLQQDADDEEEDDEEIEGEEGDPDEDLDGELDEEDDEELGDLDDWFGDDEEEEREEEEPMEDDD
uniref:WD_REPEATS_REGION domain-containing protein n=1 Tax=Caenorhabditis tropicalis TaxID=1561998 RepID=A0A1I7T283_9PELO